MRGCECPPKLVTLTRVTQKYTLNTHWYHLAHIPTAIPAVHCCMCLTSRAAAREGRAPELMDLWEDDVPWGAMAVTALKVCGWLCKGRGQGLGREGDFAGQGHQCGVSDKCRRLVHLEHMHKCTRTSCVRLCAHRHAGIHTKHAPATHSCTLLHEITTTHGNTAGLPVLFVWCSIHRAQRSGCDCG